MEGRVFIFHNGDLVKLYIPMEPGRVCLNIRFICHEIFKNLEHAVVEDILEEFSKHEDIELL